MVVTAQMAPSVRESADTPDTPAAVAGKRTPGELRRRRWADAKKKGRVIASDLGVEVECVDCARLQGDELRAAIGDAACIWVTGGNTFFLWQHMRRSGLDALVRERVAAGALYVGCSAGAIVAGRSLRTAVRQRRRRRALSRATSRPPVPSLPTLCASESLRPETAWVPPRAQHWKGWDDPAAAPDVDWDAPDAHDGMRLAEASFFPHYEPELWSSLVEARRAELGHELVTLDEESAFVSGVRAAAPVGGG